ncbi:hypothetical protein KBZ12_13515 [Cyanobium sp. Cruz CV13-4-11]|jgi:hypothetical protein|uniref:hypothetical protein n=1 Tax=unclassified Cyanobium TaxID=2627006 RepID=UPI0020CD3DDC|nr:MULTISPECIES: hypothetical protein [unclassified Cyanobium]MCP9901820.1 hypothetical protein [Cyanobium sp. Cruz CV11-17]MCP9920475.1 hypothetical protein [Cyanobium sp. Cruz CV13-4-11]
MAPRMLLTGVGLAVAAMAGAVVLHLAPTRAAVMGAPKALPYPEAVDRTHAAAEAVLAGAGAETCLRGKLTNALLGLSRSCEAKGERNPLCQLADKAAVVTPMSLAFMQDTATRLLALIDAPAAGIPQATKPQP